MGLNLTPIPLCFNDGQDLAVYHRTGGYPLEEEALRQAGYELVVLAERETAPLLEVLKGRHPRMITLYHPAYGQAILEALKEAP